MSLFPSTSPNAFDLRSYNLMPTWRSILRCPTSFDDHAAVQRTLAAENNSKFESEPTVGRYAVDLTTQADVARFSFALAKNYNDIIGRPILPDGHTVGRWTAVAVGGMTMLALSAKAALQARNKQAADSAETKDAKSPQSITARIAAAANAVKIFFQSATQIFTSARAPSLLPDLLDMVSFVIDGTERGGGMTMDFTNGKTTPINAMLLSAADAALTPAQVRRRITLGLLRQSGELFASAVFNRPLEHIASNGVLHVSTRLGTEHDVDLQMRSAKVAGDSR